MTSLTSVPVWQNLFPDIRKPQVLQFPSMQLFQRAPMLGRTHGQHASPVTFGLKMATYLSEINRHIERTEQIKPRILVGKALGPVGTAASMGTEGN